MKKYFVYILKCKDGSLYTGYTIDLERRLKCHNEGKASKYTRSRRPVEYVYTEMYDNKSIALKREVAIKKLTKKEKLFLIKNANRTENSN